MFYCISIQQSHTKVMIRANGVAPVTGIPVALALRHADKTNGIQRPISHDQNDVQRYEKQQSAAL